MLNKLQRFIIGQKLLAPGDQVVCAVSGGADSVALLFALYLLKDKLEISLSAAHFNHHLRGEQSQAEEAFVAQLCARYEIPLYRGGSQVVAGKKGLEAAAREARYGFLRTLPGKIATAHTADDNAETVLMHLIRGSGLKGLGGIAPVSGQLIRPMLTVTRREVEDFLAQWCLPHVEDSSNHTDDFLRNRLRRHVLPLLKEENPRLAENVSAMAMGLRLEESFISSQVKPTDRVSLLRSMEPALRFRALEQLLRSFGVKEPQRQQLLLANALVFSENPSARGHFPGGITLRRQYDRLIKEEKHLPPEAVSLREGSTLLKEWGLRAQWEQASDLTRTENSFALKPQGEVVLRSRLSGDTIRLEGGTRTLKKLFIDRKIPAGERPFVPVLADEKGVLAVYGIGVNLDRAAESLPAIRISITQEK